MVFIPAVPTMSANFHIKIGIPRSNQYFVGIILKLVWRLVRSIAVGPAPVKGFADCHFDQNTLIFTAQDADSGGRPSHRPR